MATAVGVERLNVPLPAGFDPNRHTDALIKKVLDAKGGGWKLQNIDAGEGRAVFTRRAAVTAVRAAQETFQVSLAPEDSKPAMGERVAANLEATYPGFYMTDFDPHLSVATLTSLSDAERRCRGALSTAMGVKPWEIKAKQSTDGGFEVGLPRVYMPSKHDQKLIEAVETGIGQVGWRIEADARTLSARIIPGEPPIFPVAVAFPLDELAMGMDHRKSLLGVTLPVEGEGFADRMYVDWTASAWALVAGTPGSGKSVALNSLVAQALCQGDVVIVDDVAKALDFKWCKPFVRDHGWGCDSLAHSVAALAVVYEEGSKRAKRMDELGYENWLAMPEDVRFGPITIFVDELSALVTPDPVPKGVPKDHPVVVETNEQNYLKAMILRYINKIIAEQRFVGMRMVLSTQVTNANTGVPPSLKNKIGQRALQGTNPSKPARTQAFNDEASVPVIPEHVKSSGKHAQGVGVADLESQAPAIYKSLWASTTDYAQRLGALGAVRTDCPAPTKEHLDEYANIMDSEEDRPVDPRRDAVESFDDDGNQLFGAAAAARASKQLAGQASSVTSATCPVCDQPIRADGACGCD